jgi:hypothetical protein
MQIGNNKPILSNALRPCSGIGDEICKEEESEIAMFEGSQRTHLL